MQEIVVAGGGVAGCVVALELVERGFAVNVLDAERVGGAATGASAGMLAPQYESAGQGPLYDLLVEGRALWAEFAERLESLAGRSLHLRRDGMLVANWTAEEETRARANVEWQRGVGQRAEILDPVAARDLEPALGGEPVSYLWLPDEAQIDSQALAEALPRALGATGIRALDGARVESLLIEGGRVRGVRLADSRTLGADAVVLAAGAWSGRVAGLPRPLPVRPVRGHMIRYPAGSAVVGRLVTSHDGRYLVPRDDGSVLAGSTMDEVGFDRSLDDSGLAAIHRSAARLVPALGDRAPAERWADLRPLTPDTFPVLGADPDLSGLYYATGYGRNGILLGPVAGRLLADVMTGSNERHLAPFAPDRFEHTSADSHD